MRMPIPIMLVIVLTGQSPLAGTDPLPRPAIAVDKVDSARAAVGRVSVDTDHSALWISGAFRDRRAPLGPNRDHLIIELRGRDDRILERVDAGYVRLQKRSRVAQFHVRVNVDPTRVQRVRIIHQSATR